MKTLNMEKLRSYEPCYDPSEYLEEDWNGTILDIVMNDNIPWGDRLWVVMREDLVSDKLIRLFAVWCARQVQHLMKDERSLKALDVAENFANGLASKEELAEAMEAAMEAAREAAWEAWDVDRVAARDAARAARAAGWAARAAGWAADREAAWDVAREAAWAAGWAADREAAWDVARDVAWEAARAVAWEAQKDQLILMILEGEKTGDVK